MGVTITVDYYVLTSQTQILIKQVTNAQKLRVKINKSVLLNHSGLLTSIKTAEARLQDILQLTGY